MDWQTVLFILVYMLALTFALAGLSAAPWVPTRKGERDALAGLLALRPGDIVYDLGCGTGTVLYDLARRFPEATFVGCEISLLPFFLAKLRGLLAGRRSANVRIRFRNLYRQDLGDAAAVFVFLMPKVYDRLRKKFAAELRDDCVAVMEVWPFQGIEPWRQVKAAGRVPLYAYLGSQFRQ